MNKEEISTFIINNQIKYDNLIRDLMLLQEQIFNLYYDFNRDDNYLNNVFNLIVNFAKQDKLLREMIEECFSENNLNNYFIDKIMYGLTELSCDDNFYKKKELAEKLTSILEQKELYDSYYYLSCYAYYTQNQMKKIFKQSSIVAVRQKAYREMKNLEDAGIFELLNIYDNPKFMYSKERYNNVKIIRYIHDIFRTPVQKDYLQHKKYKK